MSNSKISLCDKCKEVECPDKNKLALVENGIDEFVDAVVEECKRFLKEKK